MEAGESALNDPAHGNGTLVEAGRLNKSFFGGLKHGRPCAGARSGDKTAAPRAAPGSAGHTFNVNRRRACIAAWRAESGPAPPSL